ncbi:DNA polymerase, partial [Acidovorax sp. SD340]
MSLHLDARQRAMLQEMGVTVWVQPEAPVAPTTAGAPAVAVAAPA